MQQRLLFEEGFDNSNQARTLDELSVVEIGIELLGNCVKKQKFGPNYKGLCPLHEEKTPSFFLKPKLNYWICYGCVQYGGPVSLIFLLASNPKEYFSQKLRMDFTNVQDQERIKKALSSEIAFFHSQPLIGHF